MSIWFDSPITTVQKATGSIPRRAHNLQDVVFKSRKKCRQAAWARVVHTLLIDHLRGNIAGFGGHVYDPPQAFTNIIMVDDQDELRPGRFHRHSILIDIKNVPVPVGRHRDGAIHHDIEQEWAIVRQRFDQGRPQFFGPFDPS